MHSSTQIDFEGALQRDDATAACAVLREAMATYERATAEWYVQRDCGGIVRADSETRAAGVRNVAVTFDGGRAMTAWQRARAELLAAVANRRAELGDTACRPCAGKAA